MALTLARAERSALCDLLAEVGPSAPTLCEGWTTADLAAHLVVRERRPDTMPGILIPAFAGWTERVRARSARTPFPDLVRKVRSGPPVLSPLALPGVDAAANAMEYLVHHEDVRRAQDGWAPRELSDEVRADVWKRLAQGARLMFRSVPVGVALRRTDVADGVRTVRKGEPVVTIAGDPVEIVLYAFGRRDHARVDLEGPADAVAALTGAKLGV